MNIDIKDDLILNNTGRVHFIAQEHSFNLLNFLETNDENNRSHIDRNEENEYNIKFREIINQLDDHIFPMDLIVSLIADVNSRSAVAELQGIESVVMKLNEILPHADYEQKSCIFSFFEVLMFNSQYFTDYLIDNNILINICTVLLNENIPDKDKIPPTKCIHYIAKYGNIEKIFDDISFYCQNRPQRAAPFECMIYLIMDQELKQDPDGALETIRKCNGQTFDSDENTLELRYLILKFLVAILNYDGLPSYPAEELVNHIIDITIQYSESVITKDKPRVKLLDAASFGCFLAVLNENAKSCFLSSFKLKNGILNFINILDNNKEFPSITPSILLCLKSIVDDNHDEAEYLFKYNIVTHLVDHIKYDQEPIVCENAIQTLISLLVADKKDYFGAFVEAKIPDILYENLAVSCFNVKVASLLAIYELIKDLNTSDVWIFITNFNEIFERCCSLLPSEIDYDILKIITRTAYILANAYNAAGENEKLIEIVKYNDIHTAIDNFFENDVDLKTQSLAIQLKRIINLDEDENED